MRLIDADALLKKLNEEGVPYNADVNYFITNAPTVEPETLEVDKHIEMLGREYVAQDIKNGKRKALLPDHVRRKRAVCQMPLTTFRRKAEHWRLEDDKQQP